ncbi:MAG: DUF5752 family protein [Thermoleophilia bacterium]
MTQGRGACRYGFVIKDCALIPLATGARAQNLKELRDALYWVPAESIYHHFWERMLRAQFAEPEYNNDFASWVFHSLHEKDLAERLAIIDPTDFDDLEDLRQEVAEVIDQRLDESDYIPWARADQQFYFMHSQMVVFDSGIRLRHPDQLPEIVPRLSTGSIFYHFIDARRRTPGRLDDFSSWLAECGDEYAPLRELLEGIDPYFSSLEYVRDLLCEITSSYVEGRPCQLPPRMGGGGGASPPPAGEDPAARKAAPSGSAAAGDAS